MAKDYMAYPLITAIMVTGKSPERMPFAMAAITSFLEQDYPRRELIVVNDGDRSVFEENPDLTLLPPEKRIYEFRTSQRRTLGNLRNLGLGSALGSFIIQWDDDDWSHPERMTFQYNTCSVNWQATTLFRQIRYDFSTGYAYVHEQIPRPNYAVGIPGTIMHPLCRHRYPERSRGEDTVFAKNWPNLHILTNPAKYYLRFYHGANTWHQSHIMGPENMRHTHKKLTQEEWAYLVEVLQKHYAFANPNLSVAFQQ